MRISKITSRTFKIDGGQSIIRHADYQKFLTAGQIIADAERDAAMTRVQAKKDYEEACARGFQKGLEDAKQDMLRRHIDFITKAIDYTKRLEGEIFQLIKTMMQKILGQMDIDELTQNIITKTLADYGTLPEIKLHVASSQKKIAQKAIATLAQQHGHAGGLKHIMIKSDGNLKTGVCVLESPLGSVDASLDVQINALKAMLDQTSQKNMELSASKENDS